MKGWHEEQSHGRTSPKAQQTRSEQYQTSLSASSKYLNLHNWQHKGVWRYFFGDIKINIEGKV